MNPERLACFEGCVALRKLVIDLEPKAQLPDKTWKDKAPWAIVKERTKQDWPATDISYDYIRMQIQLNLY